MHISIQQQQKGYDNDGEYGDNCEVMFDNDVDSSFHPLHRKTIAVTKFEIMLNDRRRKRTFKMKARIGCVVVCIERTAFLNPHIIDFGKHAGTGAGGDGRFCAARRGQGDVHHHGGGEDARRLAQGTATGAAGSTDCRR